MTLDDLLSVVNYYAGKDKRGRTLTIGELNVLLPSVQDSLCLNELSKGIITDDSPMWKFIKHMGSDSTSMPLIVASTGLATIPSDYLHWMDMTFIYDGKERQVEILSGFDFDERKSNSIEVPTRKYPIATFGGATIRFLPKNIQFVNFTYFRAPATPFYDYCQDYDTLEEIYMPVGSRIVTSSTAGQYDLNLSGTILAYNVIKNGVTNDTDTAVPPTPSTIVYNSTTVELEWEARYHPRIACMLLAMIGVNIDESQLTQYAEVKSNA